jgi:transposase InsO family protein
VSQSIRKLTPFGRQLAIERVRSGWSLRRVAASLGVSHAWVWTLWQRFRREGAAALATRSSRPHHSPTRTAPRIEQRIGRARRRLRWGPHRLSWHLGIARSTIYAVLRRLGLAHRRIFRLPLRPVRRYERAVPGDLVHVDTKKLGRLPSGGGKRFGPWRSQHTRVGWEYLHVAVDDRTRVPYVERLRSERAEDCAGFLARAIAFFADHGVRVRQVMTDNAFVYRLSPRYRQTLAQLRLEHITTPPYTPRWNGKAEAFIGILLREWAYARPYVDNRARAIALSAFVYSYTHRRPHGELGGQTPMQRLLSDVHKVNGNYN